jgi:hypothetical protein
MNNSNLPPGCTNADIERAFGGGRDILPWEEAVSDLLESVRIPQKVIDQVMDVLDQYIVETSNEPPVDRSEPEEEEFDDDIPF